MIAMSLADVAAAVDGRLAGGAKPETAVTASVEHDSRKVTPGGLFLALEGERVDGHDFAAAATAAGAAAVLASRDVDVPAVVVDDVLAALAKLARAVVDRLADLTIVAVTGSSGKTSTKDLIAQLCAQLGPTVATTGNFNNELGHPYTVCQADVDTRYLVLEMGARHLGDIKALCEVAPPHVGAVLNVGVAHLDGFGSLDVTAAAKGELAEAVQAGGRVVLNAADPRTAAMAQRAQAPVVSFGASGDVHAADVTFDRGRARFTLRTPSGACGVALRLHGRHHVDNALAAAAVAHSLGMSPPDIADALGAAERKSPRRMHVYTRDDDVTVVDDSYNANPASTAAALKALADIAEGRKIAVLGYMADLMDDEHAAHVELGRNVVRAGVDVLVTVEELAAPVGAGARPGGVEVIETADQAGAVEVLQRLLRPGDTVLVKASRYRTWDVADHLRHSQTSSKEARA